MVPRLLFARSTICAGLLLSGGGLQLAAQPPPQEHPGQYAPADIQRGSRLYAEQCSSCHGLAGNSVGSVDLRRGRFRTVSSDDDLRRLVTNGSGTSMPAFKFNDAEIVAITAYIRAGFDVNSPAVKVGDAAKGRAIFEGQGRCGSCHRVNGTGSRVAPDLSDIGASRSAAIIQGALVDPSAYMLPVNRSVRAETRDGKTYTGRRLNEDTYTVQLIDEQERLISLPKADLRTYEIIKTSPMPAYRDKLTSEELSDLLAYLLTLKG